MPALSGMESGRMIYLKILRQALVLSVVLSMVISTTVSANTFRDVPSNHFALDAIRWVSNPANGSYMVGDASNNFNPNRVMDSFETAIILAMAAGFRYSPASITPADQAMFDRAYERHSSVLANLAVVHPNWRRVADREIAFLLELGILTQNDLANFMRRDGNGVEAPAPLTKEAASAFVIRLSDNQDRANNFSPAFSFADEANISLMYRRYVHLAHYLGVVGDYDGYFSPRRNISRAEFAQMCYILRIAAPWSMGATAPVPTPSPSVNEPTTAASPFDRTFHGVIYDVQADSIEIATDDGIVSYYFGTNPVVVIDNERLQISDLSSGMLVAVGLNETQQIISLLARSDTPIPVPTPAPIPPPMPTPLLPEPTIPEPIPPPPPLDQPLGTSQGANFLFRNEGIIVDIGTQPGSSNLVIRTSRVRLLTGEVVTEETVFAVTSHTQFQRGNVPVSFTDVRQNEIVTFDYFGTTLHNVRLQERNRNIQGSLVGRQFVGSSPVLVIEDSTGTIYEFPVAPDAYITRNGAIRQWTDLRIGDELSSQVEFEQVVSVVARGRRTRLEGTLEEIHITQNHDTIMVRQGGMPVRLVLPPEVYDIYDLRLNMDVSLYLDSREIYNLIIIDGTAVVHGNAGFIGYVQSLRHGHTVVVSHSSDNRRQTFRVDGNTINTATGDPINFRDLRSQMRLYIVMQPDGHIAQSITMLP